MRKIIACLAPAVSAFFAAPAIAEPVFGAGATSVGLYCLNTAGTAWGPCGAAFPVPVSPPVNVTPTDCSLAITAGGVAQNAIAATATLHGFTIANIDSTAGSGEPVWFSFTTTAAPSTLASFPLSAPLATSFTGLSSFTTPFGFGTNAAVSVIAVTTGHKISCTRW